MSCILYSKASYTHLVQSQLFHNCFEQVIGRLCTQEEIINWAFRLNADAYCHRYKDGETDVLSATVDDIDYEFTAAGDLENPDNLTDLLGRVRYQCADIDHTSPSQAAHFATLEAVIEAVKNSETPAERAIRLQAEHDAKEAALRAETARIEAELRAAHPWAIPQGKMRAAVWASKNIKKELSLAFPGTKFSVTTDTNSVDVRWRDGANWNEVDAIVKKYKAGSFDGMDDSYKTDKSAAQQAHNRVFGSVRYTNTQRSYSPEVLETAAAWYEMAWGKSLAIKTSQYDGSAYFDGSDYHDDRKVYELLQATTF